MAKRAATITGTALVPGVSRNGRLYTKEAIAKAVQRAQARIAEGSSPLTMLTHHAAGDDSTRIVGNVTSMTLAPDGSARFTADIADTDHGRTIASLVDTQDGKPFLRGVSIRGAWVGRTRRESGPNGQLVEAGDDLDLDGLDYTRKPGVVGATIDSVSVQDLPVESDGRTLIYESVQEAVMTVTEDTRPDAGVREADFQANTKPTGASPSDYADPGYQSDKKKRYLLDTKARAKAAWSYINQDKNAKLYTSAQLKRIKQRIIKALKRYGVEVNTAESYLVDHIGYVAESGLTEAELIEHYGSGEMAGSFCVELCNGPLRISISSYCVDPADLDLIGRAAMDGAVKALASIDPDMDGDMDVPGADSENTDGDTETTADEPPVAEADSDQHQPRNNTAPVPAADQPEKEAPAMAEEPTKAVEPTPAATDNQAAKASGAPEISDAAMDRLADKIGGALAAALGSLIPKPVATETTAATQGTVSEATGSTPAASQPASGATPPPAAPKVTETAPAPQESEQDRITRMVNEGIEAARVRIVQEMAEQGGGPARKGLVAPVTEHTAPSGADGWPEGWPMKDGGPKPMHLWTEAERREHAFPALEQYVLGSRPGRQ